MAEAAVDSGLDMELGSPEEEEEEDDIESVSSMHRIHSESTISQSEDELDVRKHDLYTRLARSQSDAVLMHNAMEPEEEFSELLSAADSARNVSECNRVYLDLSTAEPFERVEFCESTVTMFSSSSGRQLETIPQDEELKTMDLSHLYASQRSLNNGSCNSSLEDVSQGNPKSGKCGKISTTSSSSSSSSQEMTLQSATDLRSSLQAYSLALRQKVRTLQMGSIPEQINALGELNALMAQAWTTPVYGRELAYGLCDILRTDSALDLVMANLNSPNRAVLRASARLLEQCLSTPNRNYVAQCGLEGVVKVTCDHKGDVELAVSSTGILESLFKTSEESCSRVVGLGGLGVIVHWCRSQDPHILKHCAIALSNLALYGGAENQTEMIAHKAPEWLFPLAFVDDEVTRYYACLAMAVLASNREIEASVLQSGTLDLVLPFLRAHDPSQFAHRDVSHVQGRSTDWLKRLIPLLRSSRQEARALAAFHMVMEAGIKTEQGRKEVLYDIGAVDSLKWLAGSPECMAARLAAQALAILGEEAPHRLSLQVPLWTVHNVTHWVTQVDFEDEAERFSSCRVDGDLLLRLTDAELRDSIAMHCAITRKRFMRELTELKMAADYSSRDPSGVGDWLAEVGSEFRQYTYQILLAGVDRQTLMSLTDSLLEHECGVDSGIHRMKMMKKIEEHRVRGSRPGSAQSGDRANGDVIGSRCKQPIDVFLSYRRSNGSQLASLLKVHLQLRGFSVFIDVERLMAGKFDERLLESVQQAAYVVLVLTNNALDRCIGDDHREDWIHKEVAVALEAGVTVIPVMVDSFIWPPAHTLPDDMRRLHSYNGLRWIHDYQDACVDKLEKFLRGQRDVLSPQPSITTPTTSSTTSEPPRATHAAAADAGVGGCSGQAVPSALGSSVDEVVDEAEIGRKDPNGDLPSGNTSGPVPFN
ncbi:hypothetical protein ACOMHN_038550 [Nucella lapillus]